MINSHRFINGKLLFLAFIFIYGAIGRVQSQSLPSWGEGEECPEIKTIDTLRSVIVVDASSEIPEDIILIAQNDISKFILSAEYNHTLKVIITKLRNHDQSSTVILERPLSKLYTDNSRSLRCSSECSAIWEDCISENEYVNISKAYDEEIEEFNRKFEDHLSNLMKTQPSDDSPILQTLKSIDYIEDDEIFDQLYIVSDMLENSSLFDMYDSAIPDFEDAKNRIHRGYGFPERFPKKTATTTIFLLNRCGDAGEIQQTNPFTSFWDDYFSDIMSDQPTWKYIPSGPCE